MNSSPLERPLKAFVEAVVPPDDLTVSEWAKKNFRTSSDYSAVVGEFEPHPYQVEPLDVLSSSHPADMMVLCCAAQMMKTLIMLIFLGYVIDHDPGPVLIVQPTGDDAESFSNERIGPMIQDVPAVAAKMSGAAAEAKSRTTGNRILQKRFRGGQVSLTGAISKGGLRRRSVRYLLLDEVDVYEGGKNGDPLARAYMRTATYWNRKIVLCSTPTLQGSSRIAAAYEKSDQRKFFVPCPFCGHEQTLIWTNVLWGERAKAVCGEWVEPEDARYQCANPECAKLIPHHRKLEMLRAGKWIAQNPEGAYPGFHISRLYAPDWSWGRVATEVFIPATGNQEALKAFVNEILAETWTEPGEQLEWERLVERREAYPVGTVPAGGLFLTASVDVQRADGGRLECRVTAYGENRERWAVDYRVFHGDPTDLKTWEPVEKMLTETWPDANGAELPIERLFVDSGDGAVTAFVYEWVKRQPRPRVWAIKGDRRSDAPVGPPRAVEVTTGGRKLKFGVLFKIVDSNYFKGQLVADLRKRPPTEEERAAGLSYPQGYFHMPIDPAFGDEHCKQLCAERLVTVRKHNGYATSEWEQTRANEALDTQIYCDAAAWDFGIHRFQPRHWEKLRQRNRALATPSPVSAMTPAQPAAPAPLANSGDGGSQLPAPQQQRPTAAILGPRRLQIRLR